MKGVVQFSHLLLRERVRPGDVAVDATCGNGNDTLILARLVGPSGKVWAFDLQPEAVAATQRLVANEQGISPVAVVQAGHELMADFVAGPVNAIIFNLGYLPGGNKSFITKPETTIEALSASTRLLKKGGIVVLALYGGHEGGMDECREVEKWSEQLPSCHWNVWKCSFLNRPGASSWVIAIEKRNDADAA